LSIKVLEDLAPLPVDASVAFIDNDEIESFRRELLGVNRFDFTAD
jgi:hypothetical protein